MKMILNEGNLCWSYALCHKVFPGRSVFPITRPGLRPEQSFKKQIRI
jgi:hypothetical protein